MKSRTHLLCLSWVLLVTDASSAAPYTFTNIMDSTVAAPTGNYLNIGDAAISGNRVAFKAGYNQGFLGIIDSIFTSTGGPRTQVVQELTDAPSGGTFSEIHRPSIEGNKVYFDDRVFFFESFRYGDGIFFGRGLHTPSGPVVSTAVLPTYFAWSLFESVADPLISDGVLAYRASTTSSVPDSLYISGNTRVVGAGDPAPPGGTFSAIDANYGFSRGAVVFRGLYGSQEGIFTWGSSGPLATIVKEGDSSPLGGIFNTVLDPAINGSKVAFLGTSAGGSGIFTGDGDALLTVVKTGDSTPGGDTFASFSVPAIGGATVAFRGDYAGGGGIYTKTGGVLRTVVEIGDSFFGSTVTSLNFSDLGLDAGGSGNLAFTYGLADGRSGVAMAIPGAGLPTIFQDLNGTVPVPDSVGIVWLPVVDFAGRNLTNAYLSGADLKNARARNVNLTGAYLRSADLTNADLRGANLSGAVFNAARLTGASLSGATVTGASFRREFVVVPYACFLDHCEYKVDGYGGITPAQLYATTNYQAKDLTAIDFEGNNLTNANLAGQNLASARFTFAVLTGADLTGAEIRGASFGRYSIPVPAEIAVCDNVHPCNRVVGVIGSGISVEQLYSTASYLAHDLTGISFGGNDLAGANFAGQNLTNADFSGSWLYNSAAANLTNANFSHAKLTNVLFRGATLTGANLTGADARRASFADAMLTDAVLMNFIQSDGRISGLDLGTGQTLLVRDYDGDPALGVAPLPITVDEHFAMGPGGALRAVLEADVWDSTIKFAASIPVTLGGTLELAFAEGTDIASQVGRTFDLFDWTGVAPTGEFNVASSYTWNLTNLYTTGEVTLTAVPELSTFSLAAVGLVPFIARRRQRDRSISGKELR